MSVLRRNEYIDTEAAPGGVIVRILKAKKHLQGPRLEVQTGRTKGPQICGDGTQSCGAESADLRSELR